MFVKEQVDQGGSAAPFDEDFNFSYCGQKSKKKKCKVRRAKKAAGSFSDHVKYHNTVVELASYYTGMKFWQLLR